MFGGRERRFALLLALTLSLQLAGCQNQSTTQSREIATPTQMPRIGNQPEITPIAPLPTVDARQAISGGEDVTADKLDRISTLLMLFFAQNKQMPTSLQELTTIGEVDLLSPTSGQAYVYVPQGLRSVISTKFVIVYDPAPTKDKHGHAVRYCIRLTPIQYGQAISTEVTALYEEDFQAYHPDAH